MKRCVIHFGMHKTGSSSIQQSFWKQLDNPQWKYLDLDPFIANHGRAITTILVDNPVQHQRIGINEAKSAKKKEDYKNRLLAQLEADAENLLISAESLCSMAVGEEELATLRDLVASRVDKIVLVGYVRPPKSFMESAFQEKIKRSYPRLDFASKRLYPKYRKQIVKFDKVFGRNNVLLWKFDPATFTNGCVVQDFCSRLGIDFPVELIKRANDGMSREALAFLYTYHKYGSSFSEEDLAMRGEGNELLRSRLATLRGNKLRFSWAAVTPGLEAYSANSSWMARRMGESLAEPRVDEGPVVSSESDLLSYRPEDLQWLAEQLGPEYLARWHPQMTPEEVADWIHALRLKLLKENGQAVENDAG